MSAATAIGNLSMKAVRRVLSAHKPVVRRVKRFARARERDAMTGQALAVEDELASVASGTGPVIAGPWLAEVGYEVLYWVPFLRWFQRQYRVPPERLVAFSRGGAGAWYQDVASRSIEIFDYVSAAEFTALNDERQRTEEVGGRKQFNRDGALESRLMAAGRRALDVGVEGATALSPSLMFRLFRDVWHGNLAPEFLWSRTRYVRLTRPPRPELRGLPSEYVAVKLYNGRTLPDTAANREALRTMVATIADRVPVVLLETELVDDHADFELAGIPNVISARPWLTAPTNLAVQTALIAHASHFVSTCGGLAWLAPFLGVRTAAVYADDSLLAPHLLLARQAGRRTGAADFCAVDLRAWATLGAGVTVGARNGPITT